VAEMDPDALLTASQLAKVCQVTTAAVCNWVDRGHLAQARDRKGRPMRDGRNRRLYRLIDGLRAERDALGDGSRLARTDPRRRALASQGGD
jgi:hypothetical protein